MVISGESGSRLPTITQPRQMQKVQSSARLGSPVPRNHARAGMRLSLAMAWQVGG